MKRVLIIAAHPDDDILGCGGFISKYSSYKQIRVIFIGEGSSCRFEKFDDNRNLIKDEIGKRNDFGKKALNKLKINNYHFYNLPCGRFDQIPLIEINQIIENEIIKFKPDTVFTHSADDTNHDHKVVFNSSLIATRPGSKFFVERLFSYEVLSSSEWNFIKSFEPNYFVSLSKENLDQKINAMLEYKSEIRGFPYSRSIEGIKTLAMYRGMQSNNKFAEGFKSIRIIKK